MHLRLHMRWPVLYLLVHSLMHKSTQNNSSNSGLNAALHGGINVALESVPPEFTLKSHWRCIRWQKKCSWYYTWWCTWRSICWCIRLTTHLKVYIPWGLYKDVEESSALCPRHWNTGLVFSRASLTSWGEGASLALAGHPSSDGITIKMPYGVDVLHRPASHPIFSYWVG